MADQPISVHYQQMEEWLNDRRSVFGRKNKAEFTTLLELAPALVQQVQYDIPAIQKQIKKCNNSVEECIRVCEDADRVVGSAQVKKHKLLVEYELLPESEAASDHDGAAADRLDLQRAIDDRIDESCRRLTVQLLEFAAKHLPEFHTRYDAIVSRSTAKSSAGRAETAFDAHFAWLSRLEAERSLPFGTAAETAVSSEEAPLPQIDWGDDAGAAAVASAELTDGAGALEIRWDADEGAAACVGTADNATEDGAEELPPATDGQRLSLNISRTRDRTNLLAELNACACFAGERVFAKDESLGPFAAAVKDVKIALTASVEAEFMRMRSHFRQRELFEERVASFDRSIAAAQARKASHAARSVESKSELEKLEPQLSAVLTAARNNRDLCVEKLSLIFPGRKVMIVGDINKYI